MTISEWTAFAAFGLGVYALSFVSMNAALFLLIAVGVAAFVTRSSRPKTAQKASTQ